MSRRHYRDSVLEVAPPPCTECSMQAYCTKCGTACREFATFVEHGWRDVPVKPNPSWEIFDRIYGRKTQSYRKRA